MAEIARPDSPGAAGASSSFAVARPHGANAVRRRAPTAPRPNSSRSAGAGGSSNTMLKLYTDSGDAGLKVIAVERRHVEYSTLVTTMSELSNFANLAGPSHAAALPFVIATGGTCDWLEPRSTPACCYVRCKVPKSIFMTHLKWTVGGVNVEISRAEAAETWTKAAHSHNLIVALMRHIMGCTPLGRDLKPLDQKYRLLFESLFRSRERLELLNMRISVFFTNCAKLESAGIVLDEWPNLHMSEMFRPSLSRVIDTTAPTSAWPYLILIILKDVLCEPSTIDTEVIYKLQKHYRMWVPTISRPPYGNLNDILFGRNLGRPSRKQRPPQPHQPVLSTSRSAQLKAITGPRLSLKDTIATSKSAVLSAVASALSYAKPDRRTTLPSTLSSLHSSSTTLVQSSVKSSEQKAVGGGGL